MQPLSAQILLQGLWHAAPAGLTLTRVVTDSREVTPGCVFVAIAGARADGHCFAAEACQNGAAVVLGQRPAPGVPAGKMVVVPDVLDAMIAMGANYRAQFSPLVLAVTGSVGKTATKEFAAAIFSAFGETLKTDGNQNNEIGLPKTLFGLTDETRYAVVEMGMQAQGEIRKLTLAVRPSAAVITKIGYSHIGSLGSLENILSAKMEVSEGITDGGPLILNGDDPLLRGAVLPQGLRVTWAGLQHEDNEVVATGIRGEAQGQVFTIADRQYGKYETFIPALGRHYVQDALLAYTAATRLGLNAGQAAAALAAFTPVGMRQQIEQVGGVQVIADFYNAGPDSMKAALSTLAEMRPRGRKMAVLGDMLELGAVSDAAHRALGAQVAAAGAGVLATVGPLAALAAPDAGRNGVQTVCFDTNAEAAAWLADQAQDGDLVLMKASRGKKFEEILAAFQKAANENQAGG